MQARTSEEIMRKVRLMEQKFAESRWPPGEAPDRFSQLQTAVKEKEKLIVKLESEIQEQKQLRVHDAKIVEAKAAKIKQWVTNKLKELEEQNQVLKVQNQKVTHKLVLLQGGRLEGISFTDVPVRTRNRASTEDSSRGSYEDQPDSDVSLPPELPKRHSLTLGTSHRVTSSSGESGEGRQGSSNSDHSGGIGCGINCGDSDTDPLYAEVDYSKKKTNSRRTAPPRVKVERKKFHDSQVSFSSSPASEEPSDAEAMPTGRHLRDSRFDSGSVDMETPPTGTPRSPPTPMGVSCPPFGPIGDEIEMDMCNSYPVSSGAARTNVNVSSTRNQPQPPSPSGICKMDTNGAKRKPVPPPRSRFPAKKTSEVSSSSVEQSLEDLQISLTVDIGAYADSLEEDDREGRPLIANRSGEDVIHRTLAASKASSHHTCERSLSARARVADEDESHDYAEIYTPSKERLPQWVAEGTSSPNGDANKPPTPPLHRFPSWESRIYDVASSGIAINDSLTNAGTQSDSTNNNRPVNCTPAHSSHVYPDISIPVYATVKGRASQIRSIPFTGESSDSSDNEDTTRVTMTTTSSHTTSGETTESSLSTSSPSKSAKGCSSPCSSSKPNSSSPSKSFRRDASVESTLSDDYTIPPDAISGNVVNIESSLDSKCVTKLNVHDSPKKESLEKSGYLTKLGGKLKTWRKRWFVLKNGVLSYYKSQSDIHRKPQGQITIDEVCHVTRADGAATFEVSTAKKTYYLTADSIATMEEWVRVLQNVLRRNATKLLLSKEENKPTISGWLVKVKHGHSKRVWCVLIGKMFLYFKTPNDTTPIGQINMRDARVEEVEHVSDSDEEDNDTEMKNQRFEFTVGIFPNHQGPTYLLMASKQEKDTWLYHLTVVSGGSANVGTQYEQLIQRLMEVSGDPNCVIWRHPLLLYTKDPITQSLTTLSSEQLQTEAIKLFKSCQLFMSVLVDSAGIDYHVVLAQNALQQCLIMPELQNELYCQLIKQTSRHTQQKLGVQQLFLCATQSLFSCDSAGTDQTSPTLNLPIEQNNQMHSLESLPLPPSSHSKINPANFVLVQGWQLLALAVSLFLPRNSRLLWYFHHHLQRNANAKSEIGKYSTFCQRALERAKKNGSRTAKPSRMEVLSILLKNPYHHSLPHSIPVHFINGAYQVVGFDGSTTVEEFVQTLNQEIGVRDASLSGFALYSDDPIDSTLETCLRGEDKLCDVISKWETALRENKLGKFENTRVIKLTYKNRLFFRNLVKTETEKERLLLAFQVNEDIINDRFPVSLELSIELAALLSQVEYGDYHSDRGRTTPSSPGHQLQQVMDKFIPRRYRDVHAEDVKQLSEALIGKWSALKGRPLSDCIRIYINCARKWLFFGAKLFQAKFKNGDHVWLGVSDEGLTVLEYTTLRPLTKYSYQSLETFGGCRDDFMLVVHQMAGDKSIEGRTEKYLFAMTKPAILELTLVIADYMNALGKMQMVPTTPGSCCCLLRSDSCRTRSMRGRGGEPDLVKIAVEIETGRLQKVDSPCLRKGSAVSTPVHTSHPVASSTGSSTDHNLLNSYTPNLMRTMYRFSRRI
ncbi:hypothetical protein CHUAL_003752 [Chamberlinius hualienensis]